MKKSTTAWTGLAVLVIVFSGIGSYRGYVERAHAKAAAAEPAAAQFVSATPAPAVQPAPVQAQVKPRATIQKLTDTMLKLQHHPNPVCADAGEQGLGVILQAQMAGARGDEEGLRQNLARFQELGRIIAANGCQG